MTNWIGTVDYVENNISYTIQYNSELITATLVDLDTFYHAHGHAKCSPEDTYDGNFGTKLALARAQSRLFSKIARHLSRK